MCSKEVSLNWEACKRENEDNSFKNKILELAMIMPIKGDIAKRVS